MEPLPEVLSGLDRLAPQTGSTELLDALRALAEVATAAVPSCVAVSMTVVMDDMPFTLTATSTAAGVLDAAQYVDGGPCVISAQEHRPVSVDDVLDEGRWQLYDRVAVAGGIRSSMSLPLDVGGGRAPGAVNLYATDPQAFVGKGELLAGIFHVPVEELVANADLSFMTRDFARELPLRLEEKALVDRAVGVLVGRHGWDSARALERLRSAALQADVPVHDIAVAILAPDRA